MTRSEILAQAERVSRLYGLKLNRPIEIRKTSLALSTLGNCIHFDGIVERAACGCSGKHKYGCKLGGLCEYGPSKFKQKQCPLREVGTKDDQLTLVASFDGTNLFPEVKDLFGNAWRLNASIIDNGEGYYLAFRSGWEASNIHLVELDKHFSPIRHHRLGGIRVQGAEFGREDPRLFWFNNRLHFAFIGVQNIKNVGFWTRVFYASIDDDLKVKQVYKPKPDWSDGWEKNWSMFENDGQLYAVYKTSPHEIVKLTGDCVERFCNSPGFPWRWGEPRGGASPVRVGDEYWHFFHSRYEIDGRQRYVTGVYAFEARPPFRILRYIDEPIMQGNPSTNTDTQIGGKNYCEVIFTSGAVLRGDTWYLSSGEHDRRILIHSVSHRELENRMLSL